MEVENQKEERKHSRLARYVRFTHDEYEKISEDEKRMRKTAQELLKKAYFGHGPSVLLMTDEEKNHLCTQIQRIGNNVNQIAKLVNSGFALGFESELETIRAQLTALLGWMTAKYRKSRE